MNIITIWINYFTQKPYPILKIQNLKNYISLHYNNEFHINITISKINNTRLVFEFFKLQNFMNHLLKYNKFIEIHINKEIEDSIQAQILMACNKFKHIKIIKV